MYTTFFNLEDIYMSLEIDFYNILTNDQKTELRAIAFGIIKRSLLEIEIKAGILDVSEYIKTEVAATFEDNYVINEEDIDKISRAMTAKLIKHIKKD